MSVPSRLDERFGRHPLTMVIAPAGFGKSTLIQSWWRRAGDVPKALISFDAFHSSNTLDAAQAAVRGFTTIGVPTAVADRLTALMPPDGSAFGSEFGHAVEDALRSLPHDFVLFFDDVHGLLPEAARDMGRIVSMAASDRHRIVVAARRQPPWPIERWQVGGFADVITADDLRLTVDEVAELLDPETVSKAARITEVTNGWAAAVEAVRWRLRADPAVEIEEAVLDLVDYVGAEVLPVLDDADVEVLVRTAVLDRFSVRVATAVTAEPSTPRVLDEMIRRTSLVTRLEDGQYRYHAILREALQRRLARMEPDVGRELHLRAAGAWLDEPDSFSGLTSAIHHLIEAQSWERAVELMRRRWAEVDLRSRLDLFVQWLEGIPGRCWRDDVDIMLLYGWANLRIGRASRALEGLHDPTIARNPPAAAIAKVAYASTVSWTADPREAVMLVEQVRPVLSGLDIETRLRDIPAYPGVTNFALASDIAVAQASLLIGRFSDAIAHFEDIVQRRSDIAAFVQVAVWGAYGWVLAMTGDVVAGRARAEEALQISVDVGMDEHMRSATALLGRSVAMAMTGDRSGALVPLREAAARCRTVRAANLLRMCDLVGAFCGSPASYLAEVEPPLSPSPMTLVDQFVISASARRRARLGDPDDAQTILQTTTPHELTLSTWVDVLLTRHDRRSVDRWVRSQPPPTCLHGEIIRNLVEATTAEQKNQAAACARAAAEAASPGRLIGVLLDAPGRLWSRPEIVQSDHPLLLETMERLRGPRDDDEEENVLTPREMSLLRLLPFSLSVSELADRLFISVNTVKWHRANLYRKLGVQDRQEAVAAAVERGLLDLPDSSI